MRELECTIGRDDVYNAFTFFPPVQKPAGVAEVVDDWFGSCLM